MMTPSLYMTRSATSSQCRSSCKIRVKPWSNFRVSLTTRAAAFITRCKVLVTDFVAPASTALHIAHMSYVIVPAANSDTSTSELNHVQTCKAQENNLKLNCSKSKEIIFTGRETRIKPMIIPPPCLNICQVRSITALGVVLNDKLTAADHVSLLMTSCSSSLYVCEYFEIMGYLQTLYKTYIALLFSPKLHTVLVHGQAFARRTIVRDWTHSCDVASVMAVSYTHLTLPTKRIV